MAPESQPQTCYQADVDTLREMLAREHETLLPLEQAWSEGKRIASVTWSIVQTKRRIDALTTAIEALAGAL